VVFAGHEPTGPAPSGASASTAPKKPAGGGGDGIAPVIGGVVGAIALGLPGAVIGTVLGVLASDDEPSGPKPKGPSSTEVRA
jgi:hypothetical protein